MTLPVFPINWKPHLDLKSQEVVMVYVFIAPTQNHESSPFLVDLLTMLSHVKEKVKESTTNLL